MGEYFLDEVYSVQTVQKLFFSLSKFWDYLNPGLLEFLVTRFGSESDIENMSIYLKKLQQFRSSVKLGDFVRSTSSFNFKDISTCYYKKIVTIMGQGWEEKTLQDAENFKNKLAEECLIQPFLARIHASISSIALIVYLPPRVEVKMEELESFFKTRNVSQVILDDSCFFDRTKEVCTIIWLLFVVKNNSL